MIFEVTTVVATDVTTDHCCYCKTVMTHCPLRDLPGGTGDKVSACQCKRVRSLGWEDPLEEEMAIQPSILAWKNPMDRGAWQAIVHGVAKSWTQLSN